MTLRDDHGDLPEHARRVAGRLDRLGVPLPRSRAGHAQHTKFAERFRHLADHLRAAMLLSDHGHYASVRIVASGGLDEAQIDRLVRAGAPIDVFGVGTKMGVSADAPYLDTVYKLVAYDGRPVMKLSTGKRTLPGAKQVFRRADRDLTADVVGLREEPAPRDHLPMMQCVMRDGRRLDPVAPGDAVRAARTRCAADLAHLPDDCRRMTEPEPLVASLSSQLTSLAVEVARGQQLPVA